MKKSIIIVAILALFLLNTKAQNIYPISSGELLFQFSDVELANSNVTKTPMRFTMFLHLGQYWHFDICNNIGFSYSSLTTCYCNYSCFFFIFFSDLLFFIISALLPILLERLMTLFSFTFDPIM